LDGFTPDFRKALSIPAPVSGVCIDLPQIEYLLGFSLCTQEEVIETTLSAA